MKIYSKICLLIILIQSSLLGAYINTAKASTETNYIFNNNLTIGAKGNDVFSLQQFLIYKGFLRIVTPTGYFGSLTKIALGKWQTSENISPAMGFFGPVSRAKINIKFPEAQIPATPVQNTTSTTPIIITTSSASTTMGVIPTNGTGLPLRLKIPKINVDANILSLGFATSGAMQIPNNVYDVGWFNGGPRPGEKGSSIITGHVAQIRGGVMTKPGVFIELNKLITGDRLNVIDDKGESITFIVRESRLYDPLADASSVFSSADNNTHLNLITCEGTWNPGEQSYSKRLVIFTDLEK